MTKKQFVQQFKSSPFHSVMRDVRKEVFLLLDGYTREEIEEYWETKSNELAEEAWEKWVTENPNYPTLRDIITEQVEQSTEKYFTMSENIFNKGTEWQDITTK